MKQVDENPGCFAWFAVAAVSSGSAGATDDPATDEAAAAIAADGARLFMLEGFVGHAKQCNLRLYRYGGRNIAYGTAAE